MDDAQEKTADRLCRELVRRLDVSPDWSDVFLTAARHEFVPARAWLDPQDGPWVPIDREASFAHWVEAVYSDNPIVTQVDDKARAVSSVSMPSIVYQMLRHLDLSDGLQVLEIGTGSGWNAALIGARIGYTGKLVSIEVDAGLVARLEERWYGYPYAPLQICGDGADGYDPRGPYDRVISTCAVNRVPFEWVRQAWPGGVIVTPWGSQLGLGGLVRLTVDDASATATGRFFAPASFMMMSSQHAGYPDEPDDFSEVAATSECRLEVNTIREPLARFAAGLVVHDCQAYGWTPDADEIWLCADEAWAQVTLNDATVRQWGSRRLWDEVEAGIRHWRSAGRPDISAYGLTVVEGAQHYWLYDSTNIISSSAAN